MSNQRMIIRDLGIESWHTTYCKMFNFNAQRTINTLDEIWMVEHVPVFTQGKTTKHHEIFYFKHNIPLFETDRGGKITFHAPGQQIMYFLINLKRASIKIRHFIYILEKTIINTLLNFNISAITGTLYNKNPGAYYQNKKIASIGLKISKGCTSHGLSLNVNMNLIPFNYIYPCGYKNLCMTQIKEFIPQIKMLTVKKLLVNTFITLFKQS
ncbi:lipoyl(octanoyl) transferase LipB [Enterobacteriaceae endosymbiont of Macroplea appendiculata]|uniref:lipoyl(octanoyl) transferase LipB n=1 Tax=Enterobacteriaceae endosymbiont of Macroplea appendiculata TaxID=2675790 RepID=UPI001449AEDA|nr:lipoyl(octanoyl) transferase LipB [Enterobacteriaceae endosymbiont of Macroplea appendiculata]QJC30694.1 lipoyl(octanoyl) transferase LipB [Enterobacteriaceae endosymbiont of Macroplea appendiculata]